MNELEGLLQQVIDEHESRVALDILRTAYRNLAEECEREGHLPVDTFTSFLQVAAEQ